MAEVNIGRGLQASYNAMLENGMLDADSIYVCTDTGNIYLNETLIFDPEAFNGVSSSVSVSSSEKHVTFTKHGAYGEEGSTTLDLSVFPTTEEVSQAISSAISSVYKPAGSISPNSITSALLVENNEGYVYNVSDSFTIGNGSGEIDPSLFVDGVSGNSYPKGTNIVVINTSGTGQPASYKFDVLSGFVVQSDWEANSGYQEILNKPSIKRGTDTNHYAIVEGNTTSNVASGNYSHAEGNATRATSTTAHAEGRETNATAQSAHAEGQGTTAEGSCSHSEGYSTIATGNYSHAEGQGTNSYGQAAHAEGYGTTATTSFNVFGSGNVTTYTTSSDIGNDLKAGHSILGYNGRFSVVTSIGDRTFTVEDTLSTSDLPQDGVKMNIYAGAALGSRSHSEGVMSTSIGIASHAEGLGTMTKNTAEHAEGQYNFSHKASGTFGDGGNTAHSIGIGADMQNRLNAVEVMQNGDVYIDRIGGYNDSNAQDVLPLQDVLEGIEEEIGGIPSLIKDYTIENLQTPASGFLATYQLYKDGSPVSGSLVNIPKDFVLKSAELKTVTSDDKASGGIFYGDSGYSVGDKYLDFTINTAETAAGSETDQHVYANVNPLVDVYTGGDGIDVSNNEITIDLASDGGLELVGDTAGEKTVGIKLSSTRNGLEIDSNGLSLAAVTASSGGTGGSNGAMTATDKEKLDGIASGAQVNVKPSWTAAANTAQEILNKPSIGSGAAAGSIIENVLTGSSANSVTATNSHAEGRNNTVNTQYSHAEGGYNTIAAGNYSHAEGRGNTVNGNYSHVEGYLNNAYGQYSHAEGSGTRAISNGAHSEGDGSHAVGQGSHSEGYGTSAVSTFKVTGAANATTYDTDIDASSLVTPNKTFIAYGDPPIAYRQVTAVTSSTITFNSTLNSASAVSAETVNIVTGCAIAQYGHVEGRNCVAYGSYSHAEGRASYALGTTSHAEGYGATAEGNYSHAEGYNTNANGQFTHAEGYNCVTTNNYEHAQGFNNKSTSGTTLHSVGFGTSASASARRNAEEITNAGEVYIYDIGGYDGKNVTSSSSKSLQTVISEINNGLKTYKIVKLTTPTAGYSASYQLYENNSASQASDTIDIPSASVIDNAEIKTCTQNDVPVAGLVVGDKYIDFTITTTGGTVEHLYIPLNNIFQPYVAGDGISIDTTSNAISVSIDSQNSNGLDVGQNGLSMSLASSSGNGAMTSAQFVLLSTVERDAQKNVQSDWEEDDDNDDSYIQNKPPVFAGVDGVGHKNGSVVEGDVSNNSTTGDYSHSEGSVNSSVGDYSHAEGYGNTANEDASHAEGEYTYTNGHASHAEGMGTQTSNNAEHAEGMYNVSNTGNTDADKTIHSIGIGTQNNPKNAVEVMTNGDVYVDGIGGYNDPNVNSPDTLQDVINGIETEIDNLPTLGTLDTNNSAAQEVPTTAESFGSNIKLHKVSKTGKFTDLGKDFVSEYINIPTTANVTAGWYRLCTLGAQSNVKIYFHMHYGNTAPSSATISASTFNKNNGSLILESCSRVGNVPKLRMYNNGSTTEWFVEYYHNAQTNSPGYRRFYVHGAGSIADIATTFTLATTQDLPVSYIQSVVELRVMKDSPLLKVNLGSESSAKINGTDIETAGHDAPGVFGILPKTHGGTGYDSFDTKPTSGSDKAVTSDGIYTALSGFKPLQAAVSSVTPTAMGTNDAFNVVSDITQNASGVISPTRKVLREFVGNFTDTDVPHATCSGLVPQPSSDRILRVLTSKYNAAWQTLDDIGIPNDSNLVHKTGNETIGGEKTFSDDVTIGPSSLITFKGSGVKEPVSIYLSAAATVESESVPVLHFEDENGVGVLLNGLSKPVEDSDAVNKKYVDDIVGDIETLLAAI